MTSHAQDPILAAIKQLEGSFTTKFEQLEKSVANVANEQTSTHQRLNIIDGRMAGFDSKLSEHEKRFVETKASVTRHVSDSDLKHASDMAAAIVRSNEVDAAVLRLRSDVTSIGIKVDKVLSQNMHQTVALDSIQQTKPPSRGAVIATLIVTISTGLTLLFQSLSHH